MATMISKFIHDFIMRHFSDYQRLLKKHLVKTICALIVCLIGMFISVPVTSIIYYVCKPEISTILGIYDFCNDKSLHIFDEQFQNRL